jgi:hypothetical protein
MSRRVIRLKPYNFSTYEGIAFTFGFPVPKLFAQLISGLYEYSHGDARKVFDLFERLTHLMLDGMNARYQQTPPEVFPIASLGVDGVHYGYLLHAPEQEALDYPVVQVAPMERGGVALVGHATQEALENLIADVIAEEKDEWQQQELERLSLMLGLRPTMPNVTGRRGNADKAWPVEPNVPTGWRYLRSSDGVGVLAPENTFAPVLPDSTGEFLGSDWFLRKADHAISQDFPATALYYLREGYWHNCTDQGAARQFSYRLSTAYTELNRPLLAEITAWRVKRFFSG